MSRLSRSGRPMRKVHPFFMHQSPFRASITPALGDDAGRECVEHYLRGRSREAALAEWDAGRTSDPPLDWGFSSDVNSALQDYLRRTSSPAASSPSRQSPMGSMRAAQASAKTRPSEIPCAIVVSVRGGAGAPAVVRDATAFPGCGARCAADVPGPEETRGRFRLVIELAAVLPQVRVLLMLLRAEQIARLGRVLEVDRSIQLPDFHEGLDEVLRDTRPLRDASEAAEILGRLAREFAELEDACYERGVATASEQGEELDVVDDGRCERVSVMFRRYFWLVSLLASTPVFDGVAKSRGGKTVFDEEFQVEPTIRFPSSDLYCVLMVDD